MHPSSQRHSIARSYEKRVVNVYTWGTCLLKFSFDWRNSKKQLVSNSFNHKMFVRFGGFFMFSIKYSAQNKCILKFAWERQKGLFISPSLVFSILMDARVWPHTLVINIETQGAQTNSSIQHSGHTTPLSSSSFWTVNTKETSCLDSLSQLFSI